MIVMWWSMVLYSTTIDHPSTINFYMNNIFFFLYPTSDNTFIQRLIILLSNVDNTFVQRLAIFLCNIGENDNIIFVEKEI